MKRRLIPASVLSLPVLAMAHHAEDMLKPGTAATLSLALWVSVIACGRLLAYT